MRRFVLLLVITVAASGCVGYCRPRPDPGPTIALDMESYGGFAYVHTPSERKLEIAYLRDSGPECAEPVDQLGTDLMVVSGRIVEPANWNGRLFEVTGATVTFPQLEALPNNLVANRGARPAGAPPNPAAATDWEDLKWVAGISSGAQGSDYPSRSLDPNWRSRVDGRVVLTRGRVTAGHPSDFVMQHTVFEFKPPTINGVTPPGGTPSPFSQSITDTTRFTADVPGDNVTIVLSGQRAEMPSRIVVQPTGPNRPVRLKLIGRHVHNMPAAMPVGTPITHFCAFYALMQQVPPPAEQLIPHVAQVTAIAGSGVGQPSPGSSCPGDWP